MSFFYVRQTTLTRERQTFSSASAIAYQELKPDQDLGQIGVEPTGALVFLPLISLDSSDGLVRQAKANILGVRDPNRN